MEFDGLDPSDVMDCCHYRALITPLGIDDKPTGRYVTDLMSCGSGRGDVKGTAGYPSRHTKRGTIHV